MSWRDYLPGRHRFYLWSFKKGMRAVLGDGDVVCLIPYGDGVMVRKRGYYEKNLVGNLAGYETKDGDMFIMDGDGDVTFYLAGVPVVLCTDPSQMAGVIHPIKALMGQKADIGEYVRVDREDNAISHGKAIEPVGDADVDLASESPLVVEEGVHDELYDFSPPTRLAGRVDGEALADGGAAVVEQADGFVVSANKAASMVPNPVTGKELKIMQQRERNAAFDQSEMIKFVLYGALLGGGGVAIGAGLYLAAAGLL